MVLNEGNFGPIYAQNLSLKNFTVTQKFTVTPEKHPKVILTHRKGSQTTFGSKIGEFEPLRVNIGPT